MLLFIAGCSKKEAALPYNKKEAALPYNYKTDLLWPYLNKQLEDAKRNEFAIYKKNKVMEITAEDTSKHMRIVTKINKEGYPVNISTYADDFLREEVIYEYDADGIITSSVVKNFPYSNSILTQFNNKKQVDLFFKYKDGLPSTFFFKDSIYSTSLEAVYDGGKLIKVLGLNEQNESKVKTDKQVSYSGDTMIVKEDESPSVKHYTFIDKKDTLYAYGYDGDKKRIFKDGRFIFIGNETSYIKYFYKDNGLVDYTLERWSTTPEYVLELKMTRRYFFYDN